MIILIHVILAVSSLVFASSVLLSPSRNKLRASYGLIAATLVSGTYLIASTQTNILKTCVTGLVYIAAVTFMSVSTSSKLARR